jgi:uncharacterized protein YutD
MTDPKDNERYFMQMGFEKDIINAGDWEYDQLRLHGYDDPDKYSRDELIEKGSALFENDDEYTEVDKHGSPLL